ncbi:MAG: hypothetical protein C0402_11535 [Thermodesulfovibrio sp.]|nr:hypothetical protein [Thermodesulfovibrio sp.]
MGSHEDFAKYLTSVQEGLPPLISAGFRQLLENKHLYQKVEIDVKKLMTPASIMLKTSGPPSAVLQDHAKTRQCINILSWIWFLESGPKSTGMSNLRSPDHLVISLPTIKTFCSNQSCDRIEPFNPLPKDHVALNHRANGKWQQIFAVEYECQSCKGLPTVFLIRRDGLKLVLEGRSTIEHVEVPKDLPKAQKKYFSDAIVAHNSGQTLAGLFFLRTFIEQYTRELSSDADLSADKLMENYMELLPKDFKDRFPSLSKIYSDLSAAVHNADASVDLFDKTILGLAEHFEAKRLYKI